MLAKRWLRWDLGSSFYTVQCGQLLLQLATRTCLLYVAHLPPVGGLHPAMPSGSSCVIHHASGRRCQCTDDIPKGLHTGARDHIGVLCCHVTLLTHSSRHAPATPLAALLAAAPAMRRAVTAPGTDARLCKFVVAASSLVSVPVYTPRVIDPGSDAVRLQAGLSYWLSAQLRCGVRHMRLLGTPRC
jgi:hypothetical protein